MNSCFLAQVTFSVYYEPRALVKACHHDHYQGWRRGMGAVSVHPSCFGSEAVQTHSVSLIPGSQRQVILTCLHGNVALVPDSDRWTLAPGPPDLPAYQDSRKPTHKTCLRGKDSAKAELPTQLCKSTPPPGWGFPPWAISSSAGELDTYKVRSRRSPKQLSLTTLLITTPAQLQAHLLGGTAIHTFYEAQLGPGQSHGNFELILGTWKAQLTFLESRNVATAGRGRVCYYQPLLLPSRTVTLIHYANFENIGKQKGNQNTPHPISRR